LSSPCCGPTIVSLWIEIEVRKQAMKVLWAGVTLGLGLESTPPRTSSATDIASAPNYGLVLVYVVVCWRDTVGPGSGTVVVVVLEEVIGGASAAGTTVRSSLL
jgi:hypothetical protein